MGLAMCDLTQFASCDSELTGLSSDIDEWVTSERLAGYEYEGERKCGGKGIEGGQLASKSTGTPNRINEKRLKRYREYRGGTEAWWEGNRGWVVSTVFKNR
ncbi:hypothetical protein E1B28_011546 [Marasmius oreades]|uniref:Uncharacterized protein n=1 Tax=Marasmius oreades TaxID=181124 RepID=A0A9P7UQ31_9AGAR|nr:uncharacterized protein E1B28_011546 [Marasmius oreades]KAG7089913.1 hypothetical protein E1B28_011546 [Marasmius oreades]